MTFDLRLDGDVIATVDEQVTAVRLQTSRGETAAMGVAPHEGVVDIILDRVAPGGPPRLDQIEAMNMQAIRDRAQGGLPVGFPRDFQVRPAGLRADQGLHDETLREGDVDVRLAERTRGNTSPPSKDLAEGLSARDTEVLTARIEAFSEHGDADRAIQDNPASGRPMVAEQGAVPGQFSEASPAPSGDAPPSGPDGGTPSELEGSTPGIMLPGAATSGEETSDETPPSPAKRRVKDSPQA